MKSKNVHSNEFEGSTLAEAVKKAVDHFGLAKEDLDIKVVSEEQKGLFGMEGAKPAKIIAAPKK